MINRLIKTAPLLVKLGGISRSTLDRKINATDENFPKPIYMGRTRFFDVDAIDAWLETRSNKHPDKRERRGSRTMLEDDTAETGSVDYLLLLASVVEEGTTLGPTDAEIIREALQDRAALIKANPA